MRSQCKRELTTCVDRLRAKTCVFGLKLHLSDVKFDVCVLYNKIFVYCIPTLCVLIPSPPEYCVPKGGGQTHICPHIFPCPCSGRCIMYTRVFSARDVWVKAAAAVYPLADTGPRSYDFFCPKRLIFFSLASLAILFKHNFNRNRAKTC